MADLKEQRSELQKKMEALRAQESALSAQRLAVKKEMDALAKEEHDLYVDQLPTWLTREVVDAACPNHCKSNCSDQDPRNDYEGRCQRCYLLKIVKEPYLLDEGWRINLYIHRTS